MEGRNQNLSRAEPGYVVPEAELVLLDWLIYNRAAKKVYVTKTETQNEYGNPKFKGILHLKHIEQNRKGRYAYTPSRVATTGVAPSFNDRPYPEVVPRFDLPKMPY